MKNLKKQLQELIEKANEKGLNTYDINNANDFLKNNELELCFDTIAVQLYEYNILIDKSMIHLMHSIIDKIHLSKNDYNYLEELLE